MEEVTHAVRTLGWVPRSALQIPVCVVSDKLFDVTELIFSFMELEVIFIFLLYPNRLYVVKEMSRNYVL